MTTYKLKDGRIVTFDESKQIDFTDEETKKLNPSIFVSFCEFYDKDRLERYSRFLKYMENNNERT